MVIDITRLRSGIDKSVEINVSVKVSQEQLQNADLLDLKKTTVKGSITRNSLDNFHLCLIIEGILVIPCAITLKPVDVPFQIKIDNDLEEIMQDFVENDKKVENTIDIFPIIWENILMEIPMKVTSPDAALTKLEGNGWKLVAVDEPKINSELEKLKDLL